MPSEIKYASLNDQQKREADRALETRKYCYEKIVDNHDPINISESIKQAIELEKYLLNGETNSTD